MGLTVLDKDTQAFNQDIAKFELTQYKHIENRYRAEIDRWAHYQKATDKKKEAIIGSMDRFLDGILKANTGDELQERNNAFFQFLDTLDESHVIVAAERKALEDNIQNLVEARQSYLPKPFRKKSRWRGRTWIIGGTILVSAALAATIVGAPFIPLVALGGATMAYGGIDLATNLSEHLVKKNAVKLGVSHGQSFDTFKSLVKTGDEPEVNRFIENYIAPKPEHAQSPKSFSRMKKIKLALSLAGLGLALAALVAVFPPLGVPLVAMIALGVASTVTLATAGGLLAKKYADTKKEAEATKKESEVLFEESVVSLDKVLTHAATFKSEMSVDSTAEIIDEEFRKSDREIEENDVVEMGDEINAETEEARERQLKTEAPRPVPKKKQDEKSNLDQSVQSLEDKEDDDEEESEML